MIWFSSIKTIRKEPEFLIFNDFVYVIEEHKDAIARLLTNKIRMELFNEIVETHKKLDKQCKQNKRSKSVKPDDVEFIERFSSKMIELGSTLLNIDMD